MEEEKQEEIKPEEPKPTTPLLDEVRAENDRTEELVKKKAELIEKEEALQANRMMGGNAEAGLDPPKEESAKDYAKRVMAGDI